MSEPPDIESRDTEAPDTEAPDTEAHCTACLSAVAPDETSCPNCGLHHPTQVLARGGLWVVALVLCGIWALAFLIVAGAG